MIDYPQDGAQSAELPDEPWWLSDAFYPGDEAEEAAFTGGMPEDVRSNYESGPPDPAEDPIAPPGWHHEDTDGPHGAGFARGGAWDTCDPSWPLARALEEQDGRFDQMGESELIGGLRAARRLICHAQALQAKLAMTLVHRRDEQAEESGKKHLSEFVVDEVAFALHLTRRAAGLLLRQAATLEARPALMEALDTGRVDYPKAGIFIDAFTGLDDEIVASLLADLLGPAQTLTTAQLREALAAAILAADPQAAERRRKAGRKDARMELWDEASGNKAIAGRELDPATAVAIDAQLRAGAEWLQSLGAPGTLAELSTAVFAGLLTGAGPTEFVPGWETELPGAETDQGPEPAEPASDKAVSDQISSDDDVRDHDVRDHDGRDHDVRDHDVRDHDGRDHDGRDHDGAPGGWNGVGWPRLTGTIHLTMPLSALDGESERPGEAARYGPLGAQACRDVAAQLAGAVTRWCLTLTDDQGRAVGHACARHGPAPGLGLKWAAGLKGKIQFLEDGTCSHARESANYRPPESLAHLIRIRQRTCSAPGCRRPAIKCDLDHTVSYRKGGRSCECNLEPLCRTHHRAKHAPRWHLDQDRPGHLTWTPPHELTYQTAGQPYPV